MHITNTKISFDIFTVRNIFMEHDLNVNNFDPYNVLLSILSLKIHGFDFRYTASDEE